MVAHGFHNLGSSVALSSDGNTALVGGNGSGKAAEGASGQFRTVAYAVRSKVVDVA